MDEHASISNFYLIRRVRWYAKFRLGLVSFVAILGVLAQYLAQGPSRQLVLDIALALVLILTHIPLMALALLDRKQPDYAKIGLAFVVMDLFAATFSVYNYGGADSRLLVLFVIPIIVSGLFFGLRGTQAVGLASALLYSGAVLTYASSHMNATPGVVMTVIVFYSGLFVMISALSGYVVELLTTSQSRLANERQANQQMTISEATSRQQASWLDLLIDSLPVGVAVVSYPEGTVVLVNQTAQQYWGAPSSPKGQPIPDLFDETGKAYPKDQRPWRRAGATKQVVINNDVYAHLRDGSILSLKTLAAPIVQPDGRVSEVITTYADISDEKRLEQAKDEFVSLASHQLKTPASSVHSALSFLLEGEVGKLQPDQRGYIENANSIVERQIKTIDDLLEIARADAGRLHLSKASFDVTELLRETIDEQSILTGAKHQSVRLEPGHPMIVEADRERLRMVFDNLMSNASKYTHDGGHINISTESATKHVIIRFSDDGIGMSPEEQSRLFKKFSRIENTRSGGVSGSGLGLYLAKSIIELHHGRIEVDSTPNQGSTFSVWLPDGH